MPPHSGRRTALWIGALALALLAVVLDSGPRLRSIDSVTARIPGVPAPAPDPASTSGYAWGQHRVILPAIDGYHWILQTERMLAGDGWRIRHEDYDNAPFGRDVHWSGVLRWWAAACAVVERVAEPGLSWPAALERVDPWANTALLALLLVVTTPVLAMAFGAVPAAFFALGSVAVFPYYEYFVVGYFDHHGAATLSALLGVLFLAAGGAGWVLPEQGAGDGAAAAPRLPVARRWFIAAAAASGVSLWINAATVVPILASVGIAVLLMQLCVVAGAGRARAHPTYRPELWRLWGMAGGAVALGFYLLEYFPGHLGLRLEVNHPAYALAWAGGGDLLARLGERERRPKDRAWLALDAAAILLAPALVWFGGARTFRLADPFLLTLHRSFIAEFLPLRGQLLSMGPALVAGRVSPLPLFALVLVGLLWPTEASVGRRVVWGSALAVLALSAAGFAYVVGYALLGGRSGPAALAAASICAVLLWSGLRGSSRPLSPVTRSGLLLALVPAATLGLLSLAQVRWFGIDAALWLGVLVVAAAVVPRDAGFTWTPGRKAAVAGLLAGAFVVAPAFYIPLPLDTADPQQEIVRDASWWLRRRVGAQPAIVFTSPNATTWMAYFGGFRGIGSLYWENADGLRAAADLAEAPTLDSLRALLATRGVTHLTIFPWEQGLEQLRLSRATSSGGAPPPGALARLVDGLQGEDTPELPGWLTPLPYPAPADAWLQHPSGFVLEVVPDQPRELALVRLAQWEQAVGAPDRTEAALRASLALAPTVPAWALLAQLGAAQRNAALVQEALTGLRQGLRVDPALDPGDRLNAAIALAVGRDPAAAGQLERVLVEADEGALRRMSPDALGILVQLARQLGLDRAHPAIVTTAEALANGSGPAR